MKRLVAAFVVLAVIAVVVAERSSGVPSARHSRPPASAVAATMRLRHRLEGEIRSLRAAQPTGPRAGPAPRSVPPVVPEHVLPCFTAGPGGCSAIPCREFVNVPPVIKTSSSATRAMPRKFLGRICPRVPHRVLAVAAP